MRCNICDQEMGREKYIKLPIPIDLREVLAFNPENPGNQMMNMKVAVVCPKCINMIYNACLALKPSIAINLDSLRDSLWSKIHQALFFIRHNDIRIAENILESLIMQDNGRIYTNGLRNK